MELDCRSVGRFRKPKIEICAIFASFEEKDVVAGVEICKGVESGVVVVARLCIKFCVFVGVWEEGVEVCQKMAVPGRKLSVAVRRADDSRGHIPVGNTTRGEHENSIAQLSRHIG